MSSSSKCTSDSDLICGSSVEVVSEYEDELKLGDKVLNFSKKSSNDLHFCLDDFSSACKSNKNIFNCAVVGSLGSGKSEFVRYMASKNQFLGKTLNISDYEIKRGMTLNVRPFTMFFKNINKVVTFLDTSSHTDFLEETLNILTFVENIIFVIDANEYLDTISREILDKVLSKNVFIIFNKFDELAKKFTLKEILERINIVQSGMKWDKTFLGSMKDLWIVDIDPSYKKREKAFDLNYMVESVYKVYNKKLRKNKSLKRKIGKYIRDENLIVTAMRPEKVSKPSFLFKHYEILDTFIPLIFPSQEILKGSDVSFEKKKNIKVEKILINFYGMIQEVDYIAPNIPVFIEFSSDVENLSIMDKEPGELGLRKNKGISCVKAILDFQNLEWPEKILKNLESMYISLFVKECTLFGPGELFLDLVISDITRMYGEIKVVAFDVELKETCISKASKSIVSTEEKNSFSFSCEEIHSRLIDVFGDVCWEKYNQNILCSDVDVDKDTKECIRKGFIWAVSRPKKHHEEMYFTRITLNSCEIGDHRKSVIIKDVRNVILDIFDENSKILEPFLQIKVFYIQDVENIVNAILYDAGIKIMKTHERQNYKLIHGMMPFIESLGIEATLSVNTLGNCFCIKGFFNYIDPFKIDDSGPPTDSTKNRIKRHKDLIKCL